MLTEIRRGTLVSDTGVHRVALLESEKAAARLHGGIEIRSRESESVRKFRTGRGIAQAERIRGIGLLGRDYAASRPLRAAVRSRKRDGANDAVAIHDGRPHLQVQSARFISYRLLQRCL